MLTEAAGFVLVVFWAYCLGKMLELIAKQWWDYDDEVRKVWGRGAWKQ